MSAQRLCDQLLRVTDPREREPLLKRAEQSRNCLALLLEAARKTVESAPQQALDASRLAITLAERQGDLREEAAAWRMHGWALRVLGRHADALHAIDAAAAAARRAGDALLTAQVQIGRIDSLGMLGRFDEAIACARKLERDLRAEGADMDAAKALVNAGGLYLRRDRYAQALACYRRAMDVFERSGDPIALSFVRGNCANVLVYLNRVDEAISLYEQSREVFASQGLTALSAKIDGNIAHLNHVSGKYPTSLATQMRARQQFDEIGMQVETAKCDASLGEAYLALNLYPEALECFERAFKSLDATAVPYECALTELEYAAALMAVGRSEEAFAALGRAETVFVAHKNRLRRAQVRLIRAGFLHATGRSAEAMEEARDAARTFARQRLPGLAAEARFVLAELALEQGKSAARSLHAIAATARQQARGWLECRAERALGLHYAQRASVGRALRHLRAGVAALEQARTLVAPEEMHVAYVRDKLAVYEDLIRLLLERGRRSDIAEALEYVERAKSRLLLERVQTALDNRPPAASATSEEARNRLAVLRAELVRAYHRTQVFDDSDPRRLGSAAIGSRDSLAPLEHAYRDALREMELANLAPDQPSGLASVASADLLQEALRPDETLVEFFVVRGAVCAFLMTRHGLAVHRHIAPVPEILHASRRLRYHLQKFGMRSDYAQRHDRQLHEGTREVLGRLYDLLLRPLAPWLATPRLVIVPHGILHAQPFHAFFDGDRYALDRWEFVYAPSATVWRAGVRRAASRGQEGSLLREGAGALLIGFPGPGIERVATEIEQLARLLPGSQTFVGENATVEAFRAHARRCRLIHIATHAQFRADNPLFSGLRLSDGWLLARDLYEVALDCDLTTLSACHTGAATVEPGDELFGLMRGFLCAGVRSLAASLWPADDQATAALMGRLYTQLVEGKTKAEALRAAQQETREVYPHPYYWAAFVLVGER